jgi:hypothetical protein
LGVGNSGLSRRHLEAVEALTDLADELAVLVELEERVSPLRVKM